MVELNIEIFVIFVLALYEVSMSISFDTFKFVQLLLFLIIYDPCSNKRPSNTEFSIYSNCNSIQGKKSAYKWQRGLN